MNDHKLIRIVTWMDNEKPIVIGELRMTTEGSLNGVIVSETLVKRINLGMSGDFVLTPEEYLPKEEVIKTVDDAWGGRKERAWNLAAKLVGILAQEHNLHDWRQTPTVTPEAYVESVVEQHVALITIVADWLLEES